jgi:hypothetical protein
MGFSIFDLFRRRSRRNPDPPTRTEDPRDIPVTHRKKNDIVILVLSVTGAGKSTFINAAAGRDAAGTGHKLTSCTTKIQPVFVPHPSDHKRRIVFVDTPGFNDTYVDDTAIENRIDAWLAKSYGGSTVGGIVYLHDISQVRMPNTTLRDLAMFRKWCGSDAVRNVVFTTTKWSEVTPGLGRWREEQISTDHWKRIFNEGARITRFTDTGTVSNVWDVVNLIIRADS